MYSNKQTENVSVSRSTEQTESYKVKGVQKNINTSDSDSIRMESVRPVYILKEIRSELESESNPENRKPSFNRVIIRKKGKNSIVNKVKSPISPLSTSSLDYKEGRYGKNRPTSSAGIKFVQIKRYIKPKRKVFSDQSMQIYALEHNDSVITDSKA